MIVPVEVARLRQISWFPAALAVLFGVLGLVAVGYTLVSTVRRRRSELMVLKALGFDRRQVRTTFTWQATTMALVGLLLGIPLGIVTGTVAWRLVADGLGVAPDTLVPTLGIAAIVPATLVLCGLAAYLPGRAAARRARCSGAAVGLISAMDRVAEVEDGEGSCANSSLEWIGRGITRSGVTSIRVSNLPSGADRLVAEYHGDVNFRPSHRSLTETVTGEPGTSARRGPAQPIFWNASSAAKPAL